MVCLLAFEGWREGIEEAEREKEMEQEKEERKKGGKSSERAEGEPKDEERLQEASRNWSHSAGQEPCGRDGGNGTKEDHAGDYNINKQMSLEAGEFAIQSGSGGGHEAEPPPTNLEGLRRTLSPSLALSSSLLLRETE